MSSKVASTGNSKLHPQLRALFPSSSKKNEGRPSPLAVLNHLIETDMISSDAIQSSYDALSLQTKQQQQQQQQSPPKKQESTTDQYRYRHVALRFYYDGAEYSALAQNMGQESDNSIEKALFQALLKTRLVESRESCGYSRCGRTDKGVSAAGQVVAMRLKSTTPLDATIDNRAVSEDDLPKNSYEKLQVCVAPKKGSGPPVTKQVKEFPYERMLNNVLPDTIRILGWSPVSKDFSARFSATTRTYRYFFVQRRLDLQRMREALALIVGKHDFRNFCKMDVEKVYNFERLVYSAELIDCPDGVCYLQIKGQAFLWHQIRCIASILFLIGQGFEEPSVVTNLFDVETYPGKPSYPLAPERPLVLHDCGYPNLQLGHSVQNLWSVSCHMEQHWEELILAAARVLNCIDSLRDATIMRQDVLDFVSIKLQERNKKCNKHGNREPIDLQDMEAGLSSMESILSWGEALDWMARWQYIPEPNASKEVAYIPLLQRSRGTTYEEKVEALSKSKRRQQKYDENIIKKRKTAEEDAAFYNHMTQQGGTGISEE